jgi:hypothetical protein
VRRTTHISTESSDEASSLHEGGGAVWRWRLKLLTSCMHTRGSRSDVAAATASHLLTGGRSGAARGRSEPPVAVSGQPLHKLRMFANHGWPNVEKAGTCIISNSNLFSNTSKKYHIPKLMKLNNNFEAHNNQAITFYSF